MPRSAAADRGVREGEGGGVVAIQNFATIEFCDTPHPNPPPQGGRGQNGDRVGLDVTGPYTPTADAPTAPVAALSTERSGPKGRAFYRTAAALIGVPNRYMHTQVEVCSLTDLENCAKLLAEAIVKIDESTSFIPE